jgi:CheY-like chemotaxis protein
MLALARYCRRRPLIARYGLACAAVALALALELLDFSRIVAGRVTLDLQPIDLTALLNAVAESVLPAASAKDVDLSVDAPVDAPILGDVRRLEQVFFNLLGNAVKFTAKGGSVRVEVRTSQADVTVTVRDTGIGIDPAFLPYVFDRFRQGDATITRNYGGLGLGLSIVRQLVEAHKGTIAAESNGIGHGAAFCVTFALAPPRVEQPAARAIAPTSPPVPSAPVSPAHLDGIHVLVLDDEADARDVMACALAACGAKVMVASRAVEALELLVHEPVDVLLADIAMPDLDGYTFMRQVRRSAVERVARIPAAAVTAHVRDDEKRQALAAGFQVHIPKPVDPARLAHVVEHLARSRPQASRGDPAAI